MKGVVAALCQKAAHAVTKEVVAANWARAASVECGQLLDRHLHERKQARLCFLGALGEIAREEGLVRGLLIRGASASAPRGAAIAVGEVTTYDQVKSTLRRHYPDGFALHVVVSLITGVVATTVAAPFDLLKSRVMASADPADGFVQVLGRLLRNEGPLALFNGWLPTYCRLGPHAILTFPLYEAFRRLLGLDYL